MCSGSNNLTFNLLSSLNCKPKAYSSNSKDEHFKLEQILSRRRHLKRYPLQVRHKQDWGQGFILVLPQTAALPGSDAGSDVIKPASSFVIQNRQTACSMWCPMYRARC